MAQYFVDLYLWEALLNGNPHLRGVVELGTWQGGMSRYLWSQAQLRDMDFITFDSIIPDSPPPAFVQLDIYRYPEVVAKTAKAMGPIALFCDGGNKPRELALFPPMMPPSSIFVVHDWGSETLPTDVPPCLEEIYGDFCDEIGSASRVFRMTRERG